MRTWLLCILLSVGCSGGSASPGPAAPPTKDETPGAKTKTPEWSYERGLEHLTRGNEKDFRMAAGRFEEACKAGHNRACMDRGLMARDGLLGETMEIAAGWVEKACKAGHARGCGVFAAFLAVRGKIDEANTLASKACKDGSPYACNIAVKILQYRKAPQADIDKFSQRANMLFEKQCTEGVLKACRHIGMSSLYGFSVAHEKARKYLGRACDIDDFHSCAQLGLVHRDGIGGDKNESEATRLFDKACTGGEGQGCTYLGQEILKTGDKEKGLRTIGRGCALGDGRGCHFLGDVATAVLDPPDPVRSVKMYRRSCELRYPWGCVWAGLSARKAGHTADAKRYFEHACRELPTLACEAKDCGEGVTRACELLKEGTK